MHAGGGNRTRTELPPPDFESGASTNSATPAQRQRVAGFSAGGRRRRLPRVIIAALPERGAHRGERRRAPARRRSGSTKSVLASPWASSGSASMYLSASRSGVGLPAWIAANTVWIAWLSPSARRIAPWRSPSASRICDCFCASARRIAPWRSPSARRICDCFSPSASSTVARFERSARICFSIASWIEAGGSIDFSSMRLTRTPHFSVASSMTMRSSALILSREVERLLERERADHVAQRRHRQLLHREHEVRHLVGRPHRHR